MWVLIGTLCFLAFIISFIMMSTISNLIISSNSKMFSIMKALGYYDNEIKKICTNLFKWIIVVTYLLSLPIVKVVVHNLAENSMKEAGMLIKFELNFLYSALTLLILMISFYISSYLSNKHIKQIALSEALKINE